MFQFPQKNKYLHYLFFAFLFFLLIVLISCFWVMSLHHNGVPVLNYHQVNDNFKRDLTVTTEQFEAQMKYLHENGYHAITPQELIDSWEHGSKLPDNPVIITFDDGYVDNYTNAYPILRKYDLKATIFVISDYVGVYKEYINWEQAQEMYNSNIINIESHTLSHQVLTECDSIEELTKQLANSKKAIDWHLGELQNKNTSDDTCRKVHFVAYPCGFYDEDVKSVGLSADYYGGFTVKLGLAEKDEDFFKIDRIPIYGGTSYPFLRFILRLKYAPLVAVLDKLHRFLDRNDLTFLGNFIVVP